MLLSTMHKRSIVRLDEAARTVTASSSFRELVDGCAPHTSYTPTLRPNAYRHGSLEELAALRLRRALHKIGVEVYPRFGWLVDERTLAVHDDELASSWGQRCETRAVVADRDHHDEQRERYENAVELELEKGEA